MITMQPTMPLAARLGAIGRLFFSEAKRRADLTFLRNPGRNRSLSQLDDWILNDIGLTREDVMSPEARRTLNRLTAGALW